MKNAKCARVLLCAALLPLSLTPALGQQKGGGNTIPLTVAAKSFILYPSMEPVTEIDVTLDDPPAVRDAVTAGVKASPRWDCTSVSSYQVSIVNGSATHDVPIASVIPGATRCTPTDVDLNTVSLRLRSPISSSDKFLVTLRNLPDKNVTVQSMPAAGPQMGSNVVFTATPQSAPGETLVNKKTRDVGQLAVSFSDSDFVRNLPFDVYLRSTDLFSTDELDSKSAFSATAGITRGLLSNWYSPWHFEGGMQGNQIASSLSAVSTLGVTTLTPWKAVMTPLIQVPLPFDVTANAQYTNRLRQDPATTKKPLAENDFTVNPSITWTSISFPWTCKVFGWLNGDKTKSSSPASSQYKYCAGAELDLGLWYLPLDLTAKGSQRVEGYGDVSFLIPLSSLSFASGFLPHLTSGDSSKSRIRIKYSDSVNAANNYVRSKTWTYGIELTK